MTLAGRVLAGRYQLTRRLAEGGMGSIWMARHLTLSVNVAVKIMNGDGASRTDLRKRFEQEARAVAMLRSPNVISVIDYGTDQELPFIVMELLEGIDLLTLLQTAGKWPVPEVANLVLQISKGLSAAHELGLIHRDVKPGNIFLVRTGLDVTVKLLDFGIAKWTLNGVPEQNLTDANVVLGSPYYMSPEQLRCVPLDGRADLWALAVVAYRLVTGDLPFTGRDGPEIASRILTRDRKKVQPPITRALEIERFMGRAFAEDPAARFKDAKEFADQFILVAGVPGAMRIAERALTSDDEIIPTINLRRDSSSDGFMTAAEVVEEVKQQRLQIQQAAQLAAQARSAAPPAPSGGNVPKTLPSTPPRPAARTQRMQAHAAQVPLGTTVPTQAMTMAAPRAVPRPGPTPVVKDKKEDSVTNIRKDVLLPGSMASGPTVVEEMSTNDLAADASSTDDGSSDTLIGSIDDVEDTVTDLPLPGTR